MSTFNDLCNSILCENSKKEVTIKDLPVGKVFKAKGIGNLKKISNDLLLGLNGVEYGKSYIKKYESRIAQPSEFSDHDFDLTVKMRQGKISKKEFNSKVQNSKWKVSE
jgi:hypothetical protein